MANARMANTIKVVINPLWLSLADCFFAFFVRNSPQCLHFTALSSISSAQNGHAFVAIVEFPINTIGLTSFHIYNLMVGFHIRSRDGYCRMVWIVADELDLGVVDPDLFEHDLVIL